MSESLIVKNGNGEQVELQVEAGSENRKIPVHTLASTVSTTTIKKLYPDGPNGWTWTSPTDCTAVAAQFQPGRKSIIIQNSGSVGVCYIKLSNGVAGINNTFGEIQDTSSAPPTYSFILEPGGIYFGNTDTAALRYNLFVPYAEGLNSDSDMVVMVTEIF